MKKTNWFLISELFYLSAIFTKFLFEMDNKNPNENIMLFLALVVVVVIPVFLAFLSGYYQRVLGER